MPVLGSPITIRLGYELRYQSPQPTPMILTLNVHYSRVSDLVAPDHVRVWPSVPLEGYRDGFGNWCTRLVAPPGELVVTSDTTLRDDGHPDPVLADAIEHSVESLPQESLLFLLGSRYCETDVLSEEAWKRFGRVPPGWSRVQAVCDFVHQHVQFDYGSARPTMTAGDVYRERRGVCRDFTHLAVTLCRCLNIPARYCTGYVTDIGQPPPYPPMDFAAWFEAYLGGGWRTFDPRNNTPRIGRVLMARGRDAADVALSTIFGPSVLSGFRVWAEEVGAQ